MKFIFLLQRVKINEHASLPCNFITNQQKKCDSMKFMCAFYCWYKMFLICLADFLCENLGQKFSKPRFENYLKKNQNGRLIVHLNSRQALTGFGSKKFCDFVNVLQFCSLIILNENDPGRFSLSVSINQSTRLQQS